MAKSKQSKKSASGKTSKVFIGGNIDAEVHAAVCETAKSDVRNVKDQLQVLLSEALTKRGHLQKEGGK